MTQELEVPTRTSLYTFARRRDGTVWVRRRRLELGEVDMVNLAGQAHGLQDGYEVREVGPRPGRPDCCDGCERCGQGLYVHYHGPLGPREDWVATSPLRSQAQIDIVADWLGDLWQEAADRA